MLEALMNKDFINYCNFGKLFSLSPNKSRNMKKFLFVFALIPLMSACNQDKLDALEQENADLKNKSTEYKAGWDAAVNEISSYMSMMNEIDNTLIEIKKTEGLIDASMHTEGRSKEQQRDDILANINTLNDLIKKNKDLVRDLDKKYKGTNLKIKELDEKIALLNEQLAQKEADLAALKSELESAKFQITNLNTELATVTSAKQLLEDQNNEQARVIADQTDELNTAYYISGTYKELKELGIVDKEGGFIGIGANKELVNDFDASSFTKVDIRKFKELPINSKSAKVITTHTTDSYTLVEGEKEIEELVIENPDEFWKTSKFLVVLTD